MRLPVCVCSAGDCPRPTQHSSARTAREVSTRVSQERMDQLISTWDPSGACHSIISRAALPTATRHVTSVQEASRVTGIVRHLPVPGSGERAPCARMRPGRSVAWQSTLRRRNRRLTLAAASDSPQSSLAPLAQRPCRCFARTRGRARRRARTTISCRQATRHGDPSLARFCEFPGTCSGVSHGGRLQSASRRPRVLPSPPA